MINKDKRPQTSKSLNFLLNYSQQNKSKSKSKIIKHPQRAQFISLHENTRQAKQMLQKQEGIKSKQDNQPRQSLQAQFSKWQNIASKLNNQLHLKKIIYKHNSSANSLTKYGGKLFRSQSKQKSHFVQKQSEVQHSLERKKSQNNFSKFAHKQTFHKILKVGERSNLKKRSKIITNNMNPISKQLSINKLFYENPVKKIGFNMQYQAKLKFQHLQRLEQYKGLQRQNFTNTNNRIQENTIIFYLKDSPFSAHIITQKNDQTPICISLFPQFFHSKLSSSNYIRQRYLQKMRQKMNNTYDPEVMARMPMVTRFPKFNQQAYIKILRQFLTNYEECYDPKWAQNIIRKIKIPLKHEQTSKFLKQLWDLFNKSNAISNLDYILKDQAYVRKFNISPYLNTRLFARKQILYHGGYSRSLYPSWCSYIKQGKKSLASRLKKYNQITQALWNWMLNFSQVIFFQINFLKNLNRPISINVFKRIQQSKIQNTKKFMKNIWMRGVILIHQFQLYLQTSKDQYSKISQESFQVMRDKIVFLKKQLNKLKIGNKFLNQVQEKIINTYCEYLKTVQIRGKSNVSQPQFMPVLSKIQQGHGHKNQKNNIRIPPFKELRTPITIHYSSIIQKSITSLRSLIYETKKKKNQKREQKQPILKLTLIVDRQNIKFKEKQEQIIQTFGELVQDIFNFELKSFHLKLQFNEVIKQKNSRQNQKEEKELKDFKRSKVKFEQSPQKQILLKKAKKQENQEKMDVEQEYIYPQIKIVNEGSQISYTSNFITQNNVQDEQDTQLTFKYPYAFNHQKQVNSILYKIHEYYRQSSKLISLFNDFMPFIKLTTSKYIFHEQQNVGKSAQGIFLKDLQIIKHYRQELQKINVYHKVKIFQVSCEEPIKQLTQRMNQVEYLIQQKYLNKIFDQIHETENKLNVIKNQIQSKVVKIANIDQLENQIEIYEVDMLAVRQKIKQISHKILFSIKIQKANSTLILRNQQLVKKKKEIQKELRLFKIQLRNSKPQLERKIKNQSKDMVRQLQELSKQFHIIQQEYINPGQMDKFLLKVTKFLNKIQNNQTKLHQYSQNAEYVLPSEEIIERNQKFKNFKSHYQIFYAFWNGYSYFQTYLKKNYKVKVINLDIVQFQQVLNSSKTLINVINSNQTQGKPFLHKSQCYYLQKFIEDVNRCSQVEQQIIIISNPKIQQRHWIQFKCQQIIDITLGQLMRIYIQQKDKFMKLFQMEQQAQIQFKIFDTYDTIKRQLKQNKIKIIDVNGSDVLDIQLADQILEKLYNWKIDLDNLLKVQVSEHFQKDIKMLLQNISSAYLHLLKWKQIQKQYIKITNYFVPNQQNIAHSSFIIFDELRQTHRKLIKSFDLNNSIWYISENIVLPLYNQEINKKIQELNIRIDEIIQMIRKKYPRLYLLSDEQLLLMMSSGTKIQKFVQKCLRHIEQIDIKEGAIERVGKNKHLKFFQPMYILDKLSMVYQWMPKFQLTIKKNMRDLYKTNFISTLTSSKKPLGFVDNYPIQLTILDQFIQFTHLIEESIPNNTLGNVLEKIKKRIHESIKSNNDSTFTLLFIKFRQTVNELISEKVGRLDDFTWYKNPHFYNPQSLTTIEPKIVIMNQSFQYGFNYFQNPQIIFHDHSFFGNTLVGDFSTGKKAICRYYSYITGSQMLVFDPDFQCSIVQKKSQTIILKLINFIKISVVAGSWLYIDKMDNFSYEDFSTISQCIGAVNEALNIRQSRVMILGQTLKLNKDAKIFLSFTSLNNQQIPSVLAQKMRPMWVTKPNDAFLLNLYLQGKTYSHQKINEFISFCSWIQTGQENQKCMIDWVRKQNDKSFFRLNNLFVRLIQNGYVSRLKQLMDQKQKHMPLSNIAKNQNLNLDDQISFISYSGMLIYGSKNTGKTYQVLKILQKYAYTYIDMRLYPDKLFAVQRIINQFSLINPKPLFLLIRNGIQFYQLFQQLSQKNVRLIFIENDLRFSYFSLLNNLVTLNYNQFIRKQMQIVPNNQNQPSLTQFVVKNILANNYDRINSDIYSALLNSFENHLKSEISTSNIKITFAKILKQMLSSQFQVQISFIYSAIWSFGNFIDQISFLRILNAKIQQNSKGFSEQSLKTRQTIDKLSTYLETINFWLKQGKILSLFDLIPAKNNQFENNSHVQIQFISLLDSEQKLIMQLGMIQNLKNIRNLNLEWKIKIESRDWLSTILDPWITSSVSYHILLNECQKLSFENIVNKILFQIKKNRSSYVFPKNCQIIIDDLHLQSYQNFTHLEHLSIYKSVLYLGLNSEKLSKSNIYTSDTILKPKTLQNIVISNQFNQLMTKIELKNCGFTFGTKFNLTYHEDQKSILIKIKDQKLQNIYHQFFRVYWCKFLTVDIPITELFSLSLQFQKRFQRNFSLAHYKLYPFYAEPLNSKIFRKDLQKMRKKQYFWFKNPLMLTLNTNPTKLSEFYNEYLKIITDILPQQTQSISSLHYSLKITDNTMNLVKQTILSVINNQGQQQIKQIVSQNLNTDIKQIVSQNINTESILSDQKIQNQNTDQPIVFAQQIVQLVQKKLNCFNLNHVIDSPEIDIFLNDLKEQEEFRYQGTSQKYEIPKVNSNLKISKYMKQYILKIYRQLKHNHLVMVGELHTQRQTILKTACKLLKFKFIEFQPSKIMKKILMQIQGEQVQTKIVLLFKSLEIKKQTLTQLLHIIKFKDFTPWINYSEQTFKLLKNSQQSEQILNRLRFVLKINIEDQNSQQLYQNFHNLKSYFVNVFFQTQSCVVDQLEEYHEEKKILKNGDILLTNDLELQWKQDIQHIYKKYHLPKQFLITFPLNYKQNKESQYQKLQYYRKITSEMVVNIDRLATYNSRIPLKLAQRTQIIIKIQQKKQKIRKQLQKIKINKYECEQQVKYIQQLLQDSENNKQFLNQKIEKVMAPTVIKMDKIQRKLQNMESGEYLKVKTLTKNQYVYLIVSILNMFIEEYNIKSNQKSVLINLPFTRNSLMISIKQLKKKCNKDQILQKLTMHELENFQTKLKGLKDKIQELKSLGVKKIQKIGPIFKYLYEWIMFFYEKKTIFDDYCMKFKYTFNHLRSQLSNLSQNSEKIKKEAEQLIQQNQKYQQEKIKPFQNQNSSINNNNNKQNQKIEFRNSEDKNIIKAQKEQVFQKEIPKIQQKAQIFTTNNKINTINEINTSFQDPTAIRNKLEQEKSKLIQMQERINHLNQQKQNFTLNQKAILNHKRYLSQKMENLTSIINSLSDREYMKNVSSNIASYFKNIPKIAFLKTLLELKYNEYLDDQRLQKYKLDVQNYFNVFSQNQSVRLFKIKYGLYHLLNDQVQCLYNIVHQMKPLVLVQDRQSLIKQDLITVCESLSYHIIFSNNLPENELQQLILKKLKNYNKVLVLNSNYLNETYKNQKEINHYRQDKIFEEQQKQLTQSWPNFDDFIYKCHQQMGSISNEVIAQKKIIILNFKQPKIKTQLYKVTNNGKINLTFERFMTDLTFIFQLISNSEQFNNNLNKLQKKDSILQKIQIRQKNQKEKLKQEQDNLDLNSPYSNNRKMQSSSRDVLNQILKLNQFEQKSDDKINHKNIIGSLEPQQIQLLINEQSFRMKQNLKNLSSLTQMIIEKSYEVFQITDYQIQDRLQKQHDLIKQIQDNLLEISLIQETIQLNSKMSSNYRDQSDISKSQLNKVGLSFYWIFSFLKKTTINSESPLFGNRQLYQSWIKCIKALKSENHLLFSVQHDISKRFQIGIDTNTKNFKKQGQRQPNIVSDIFKVNMRQIIKLLIIKLVKNIVWQEKAQVQKFLVLSFIVFFISIQISKCKATVFKNIKQMVDHLINIDVMGENTRLMIMKVEAILNKQFKKSQKNQKVSQQISEVSKTLLSFLVSNNNKTQKKYNTSLWVDLVEIYYSDKQGIHQLIEALRKKNKNEIYDQKIKESYDRLKSNFQIEDIIKQAFSFKHQFQSIKLNANKNAIQSKRQEQISLNSEIMTIQFKQVDFTNPLVIIQDNQQALQMVVESLKLKAKLNKKQWVSLLYNESRVEETIKYLKNVFEKGKTWVYLTNFNNTYYHINNIKKITYELQKMNNNPTVKVFVIIPVVALNSHRPNQNMGLVNNLLYNKYEVTKIVGASKLDFQETSRFILSLSQKSYESETKQCFSIKTLQKITGTNKKINMPVFLLNEIYQILIMGFRFLSQKFKIYTKKNITLFFLNYLQTYEALYPKVDRIGKNGQINALKYIYQHFKAISECTLQSVKNQIEISLKLKNQNLDYKKFAQAQTKNKQAKTSISVDELNIQYITLFDQRDQKDQISLNKSRKIDYHYKANQQFQANAMKKCVFNLLNVNIANSNQIFRLNYFINNITNEVQIIRTSLGLNITRKNISLYANYLQNILKALVERFNYFLKKYTPITTIKVMKQSLKNNTYKIRSANQLLVILNQYKLSKLQQSFQSMDLLNSGKKATIKKQSSVFKNKEKLEQIMNGQFILKQKPNKNRQQDKLLSQKTSQIITQKIIQKAVQVRQIPQQIQEQTKQKQIYLNRQQIDKYFLEYQVLKQSFIICFSSSPISQVNKTHSKLVDKYNGLRLGKDDIEEILQRYVIIIDFSQIDKKINKKQGYDSICTIQLLMK